MSVAPARRANGEPGLGHAHPVGKRDIPRTNIRTKPTAAHPVDRNDDPAIVAIAAHRRIWDRLLAAHLPVDEDSEPELARRWHRLSSWETLAAEKVASTVPTTVEGAAAFAKWVKEILFFEQPGRHSVALEALETMRTCINRLAPSDAGSPREKRSRSGKATGNGASSARPT
jgi:hypothetical protein